jgi:hypothetical protein
VHSLLLIGANVDTVVRLRTMTRAIRSPSIVVHEVVGTIASVPLLTVPWILGGLSPTREDLTWSILIAFATAFLSVVAIVLFVLDVARFEPDKAEGSAPAAPALPRGERAGRPAARRGSDAGGAGQKGE